MATIETLIAQIADPALREQLSREMAELKKRLEWGLVFERHLPEKTRLLLAPIKVGSAVWERRAPKPRRFRVRAIEGPELVVAEEPDNTVAAADAPTERMARSDVLVEHDFAQPAFPVPTPIGAVRNGPADRPHHAVIQGENYHVLESLLSACDGPRAHIIDPHDHTKPDAVGKAKGLSAYADKHADQLGHMDLVAKIDGRYRRLHLEKATIRKQVDALQTLNELRGLYVREG